MSKTVNVYLDDDSCIALEKQRATNPNFNFSAFISAALLEEDERLENPEVLESNMRLKINERDKLEIEMAFLQKKLIKMREKEFLKAKEEEARKSQMLIDAEGKRKRMIDSFMVLFGLEYPIAVEHMEAFLLVEKDNSIFDYAAKNGLVQVEK